MSRRSPHAVEDAAKAWDRADRDFSSRALDAKAVELAERRKQTAAAAWWAHGNSKGSKAACKTGQFGEVTYTMVEPLLCELKQTGSIACDRDHHSHDRPGSEAVTLLPPLAHGGRHADAAVVH